MKDNLMQKMCSVFESIMKSEGATALTNERIKKCCEENDVDYEEFSASVIEEVLSVIGAHSGNSGNVLLSELSSNDLEAISGGMGNFRRGTASALAALSLCGATQLPAFAGTHKASQVEPKNVASRHKPSCNGTDTVITSQAAKTVVTHLATAGLGAFLTYLLMQQNSDPKTATPSPNKLPDSRSLALDKATHDTGPVKLLQSNGFLPEHSCDPPKDCFTNSHGQKITPSTHEKDFRVGVLYDTLGYCQKHLGFQIENDSSTPSKTTKQPTDYRQVSWKLPPTQAQPTVITDYVTSVRVTKPVDPAKCAKIWISNGRSIQTMNALKDKLGKDFNTEQTAVLDFANFFTPGGGALEGCVAQEESICRITTLYPLLRNSQMYEQFYNPHRAKKDQTTLTDLIDIGTFKECAYVPGVRQLKNDYGAGRIGGFINGSLFSIIVAAAANLSQLHVNTNDPAYSECFKTQWRQIIGTAVNQGNVNLVAGALGCGAFNNDPKVVAETFFDVLLNEGPNENECWASKLKHVVLPIYIYINKYNDFVNYYWFFTTALAKKLQIQLLNLYCPE